MKTSIVIEQPIFTVDTPCEDKALKIYADDLRNSNINDGWSITNQDRYPNRTCTWEESFTVIYKNRHGVAVLYESEEAKSLDYHKKEETELIWVDLHNMKKE